MSGPTNRLIVFVRAPRPGLVKTRLAAAIGEEAAAHAYQVLVQSVLDRLNTLQEVELHYSPEGAAEEIRAWVRPGWSMRPQSAGTLGDRMHAATVQARAEGIDRIAIIGSDCPYLTAADIEAAWAGLDDHDVVLGPASDGGYWLIALRAPNPCLFLEMEWSTHTVLATTRARAAQAGLRTLQLRELSDVDTEADWRAFASGKPCSCKQP